MYLFLHWMEASWAVPQLSTIHFGQVVLSLFLSSNLCSKVLIFVRTPVLVTAWTWRSELCLSSRRATEQHEPPHPGPSQEHNKIAGGTRAISYHSEEWLIPDDSLCLNTGASRFFTLAQNTPVKQKSRPHEIIKNNDLSIFARSVLPTFSHHSPNSVRSSTRFVTNVTSFFARHKSSWSDFSSTSALPHLWRPWSHSSSQTRPVTSHPRSFYKLATVGLEDGDSV